MVFNAHKRCNKQRFITLEISRGALALTLSLSLSLSLTWSVEPCTQVHCTRLYGWKIRMRGDCTHIHRYVSFWKFASPRIFDFFFFSFPFLRNRYWELGGGAWEGWLGIVGNGVKKCDIPGLGGCEGWCNSECDIRKTLIEQGMGVEVGRSWHRQSEKRSIGREWEPRFWFFFRVVLS